MKAEIFRSKLFGTVKVPPSKSYLHRALIAAALADGETVINNFQQSDDISATVDCIKAIGAKVQISSETCKVSGGYFTKNATLNCNESGTTLRLFMPICAALGINSAFLGRGKLPDRPNTELLEALALQGIQIDGDKLPITFTGKLKSGEFKISGGISSQYISGLLFALPLLDGDSKIVLKTPLMSSAYVDITLDVLRAFGIKVERKDYGFFVCGGQKYAPVSMYCVEGDFSQAAFWLVGGAIAGEVAVKGLNLESIQGDRKIIDILRYVGANVKTDGDCVTVSKGKLKSFALDCNDIIDLVPVLSSLAVCADGESQFSGVERLKIKESDRLSAVINNLAALEIKSEYVGKKLVISGGKTSNGNIDSFNDHRIIMAFAVLGLVTERITIANIEAINKSYPRFFDEFSRLGGNVNVIYMGK